MKKLNPVHFVHPYLLNPTNPVTVNLIGAGGTGSQMLTALGRIHKSMLALGHPGLMVNVYDDDRVSTANLGRQLFADAEVGLYKSVALVNRMNLFMGTNWKGIARRYDRETCHDFAENGQANIFITCVDNAMARFDIAAILNNFCNRNSERNRPMYWLDLGNSRDTGQAILATVGEIKQPASKKFIPVPKLPFVTEIFRDLIIASDSADDTPSCSIAEALTKQDLFINSALANMAASLLWQMFREGMVTKRGIFLNLQDFRMQPLMVILPENSSKDFKVEAAA